MILGPKQLLQLVKEIKLVENLSERELTNPEGAGFDLRLGEVYKISGTAFLGETHRHTAEVELVAKFEEDVSRHPDKRSASRISKRKDAGQVPIKSGSRQVGARMTVPNSITIQPGEFYLVKTIESVNMPENLTANMKPRSTTFRSGIFIRTGNIPPGYCGGLTFGLKNEGPVAVTIEMGARIIHVQFEEVQGGGNLYRGQWQGGRVTTTKKEKQV